MSCRLLRGASEKNLSFKSEVNFPSQAYICMYHIATLVEIRVV